MKPAEFLLLLPVLLQSEVEQTVAKVSEAYRGYADVEMPFRQQKFVTILKEPVESSGVAKWKPNRLLFRTTLPEESEVLITDREILIWIPATEQIEKYDRAAFKMMETLDLGLGHNVKDMVAHYEVGFDPDRKGRRGDPERTILHLKPTDKQIAKYIRELWMWVRTRDSLIFRVEYVDSSGDRTVTDFDVDFLKANQGLTDETIRLSAPAGTKVVEPLKPGK